MHLCSANEIHAKSQCVNKASATCCCQLANYEFFERLELVCCGQLSHYELSVFKPSTADVRPAAFADSAGAVQMDGDGSHRSVKMETAAAVSSLSLALSLS